MGSKRIKVSRRRKKGPENIPEGSKKDLKRSKRIKKDQKGSKKIKKDQ
jgi:hypothetical protein